MRAIEFLTEAVAQNQQGVAEGSLEEVDRRGFLKGMGAAAVAGAAGTAGAGQYKSMADLNKNPAQLQQVWKPRVDELRNRCYKILKSFIDVSAQSAPDYVKTLQSIQIQVTLGDSRFRNGRPVEAQMTSQTKKGQFVRLTSSEIFLEATVFWDAPDSTLAFVLGHECGHIIMQHFANPASKRGKDAETEADLIGAFLAKKIGYSKANVFQFLFGVKADMLKNRPGDDHPEASDRVKFLKQKAGFELSAVKYIDSMVQQFQNGLAEDSVQQGVAEDLSEEFDLIESIIEDIAAHNGVDAEAVWADLESLTEDELYAFAVTSQLNEDWQKANKRDKTDGMSQKAVNAYRRENPGSKLKTAVTTKPSKLKKGGKASKRRKSYCSRSRGQMKMHSISCAKTPDKAICKARRRWNC
jgi:hypothetical protein